MSAPPLPIRLLLFVIVCSLWIPSAAAQDTTHAITTRRIPARVGDTPVVVVVHRADTPGPTYLNLHDDENTAVRATLEALQRHGGRLVEIQHTGTRNVTFALKDTVSGDTSYTFDPNRIFTDRGAAASLEKLGPSSKMAHTATRAFARKLLEIVDLKALDRIVTVHNNTEGNYSARSYVKGGVYAKGAAAVYLPDGADPDDFFFVTTRALYDALRAGGSYPVVLQDNARVADDGSLSVYCGQQGCAYVNVEAQQGHLKTQIAMLAYLWDRLRKR